MVYWSEYRYLYNYVGMTWIWFNPRPDEGGGAKGFSLGFPVGFSPITQIRLGIAL